MSKFADYVSSNQLRAPPCSCFGSPFAKNFSSELSGSTKLDPSLLVNYEVVEATTQITQTSYLYRLAACLKCFAFAAALL